jgi:hypothetical protein
VRIRERDIEAAFVRYAKARGCVAYKFTSPGRAGVPDRLVVTPVGAFFIEFKRPGEKPTRKQQIEIDRLRLLGQTVLVIDQKGLAEGVLDLWL